MVELLSPIALPDALAEASLGFRGCWSYGSRGLIVPIDWGQSIYHASGDVLRFSHLLDLRIARTYRADRASGPDFVVLVLSEAVLSETVLVLDGCLNCGAANR